MIESVQFGIPIDEVDISLNISHVNTIPVSIEIIPHKAIIVNDTSEIIRNRSNTLSNRLTNRLTNRILDECKRFIFTVFSFILIIAIVSFLFIVPKTNKN